MVCPRSPSISTNVGRRRTWSRRRRTATRRRTSTPTMSTAQRLVQMILRGKPDQFNTIIKEYLNERASVMMEQVYLEESKNILNH